MFTATVAQASGPNVPTGTVQFSIDGSSAGSPVALSGGVATFSTSTLPQAHIPSGSVFAHRWQRFFNQQRYSVEPGGE